VKETLPERPEVEKSERTSVAVRTAKQSNVRILGWTAFWSGMSQEMVYPLLPIFLVVALSSSKTALGVVEGLLGVGVTLARYLSGRAVDRGRSPLRLTRFSYAVSLIARPLIAAAPSVLAVGILRVADGLGKGGKDAPRDVLVAADADDEAMGRSFGLQVMLDTLGSVAGPLAAAGILFVVGQSAGGLRLAFALASLPAFGAIYQLRRAHDVTPRGEHVNVSIRSLPRPFFILLIAVTLFGIANSSDTLLLLRAHGAGLNAAYLAVLFAGFNLVYALLAVPAGALSDRIGRRPLLIAAWIAYAATYAGFAFASRAWQLIALFLGYGVYYAIAQGTIKAWVVGLVPEERRGTAFGLIAAASGLLLLPASVIAGVLWDSFGPKPAFLFGSIAALAALAVVILSPSLRRQIETTSQSVDSTSSA
jgi:MFS family permease